MLGQGLTTVKRRAARLLAGGLSKPLRRWGEQPAFAALLAKPVDPAEDLDVRETLRELLHSPNERVRLAAATELLRAETAAFRASQPGR